MTTIQNRAQKPLKVPLPRGKSLFLAPGKSGQIADDAVEHAPLKKLIDAGELEVLGHGAGAQRGTAADGSAHANTRGHVPGSRVERRGDRGG